MHFRPPKHFESSARGTKTVGKPIILMPMKRGGRRRRRRAVTRVKREYASANIDQGVKITTMADDTGLIAQGTKSLLTLPLTHIVQGAAIDQRERQTLRIVGIKINGYFVNSYGVDFGVSPQVPVIVNIAVVFPKHDVTLPDTGFFRREGGIVRGQNFTDTGNLCGMDYATKQINSDKIGVLWRKKIWLSNAVTNSGFSSGSAASSKMFTKYLPLYRSVQYSGTTGDSCDDKLYLIWWCSAPSEPTGAGAAKGINYQLRVNTYWREPKDG